MTQESFFQAVLNGDMDQMMQQLVTGRVNVLEKYYGKSAHDIAQDRGDKEMLRILTMAIPLNERTNLHWQTLLDARVDRNKNVRFDTSSSNSTIAPLIIPPSFINGTNSTNNSTNNAQNRTNRFESIDYDDLKVHRQLHTSPVRQSSYQQAQAGYLANYKLGLEQLEVVRWQLTLIELHPDTSQKRTEMYSLKTTLERLEEDAARYLSLMDDNTLQGVISTLSTTTNTTNTTNSELRPPAPPPLTPS